MVIQAHPTESDYRHALAAHGVWAIDAKRKGGWRKKLGVFLWVACFGALGIAGAGPEVFSRREWVVPAVSLIAAISFYPLVLVLMLVQRLIRSPSSLRPEQSGIVEQSITPKGGMRGSKNRSIAFWIVIPAIGVAVALLQSHRTGPSPMPVNANSATVTTDNASIRRVSGEAIFFGTLFAAILLGSLLVRRYAPSKAMQ